MSLTIYCPRCFARARYNLGRLPTKHPCTRCALEVPIDPAIRTKEMVDVCAVCGLGYFYIQARFDRRLGCAVLIAAAVLFLALANRGHWWAPFVLVGVAAVDWAAYRMLPRAAICYKCLAEYRGFRPNPEHRPYELATASHFADHDRPDTSQGDRDRV